MVVGLYEFFLVVVTDGLMVVWLCWVVMGHCVIFLSGGGSLWIV